MAQPESRLSRKIVTRIQAEYGEDVWVRKIHGGQFQAGVPDILGCLRGTFFAIEVKMPGRENRVTDQQRHNLDKIETAGGYQTVCSSWEDALDFMKHIAREEGHN